MRKYEKDVEKILKKILRYGLIIHTQQELIDHINAAISTELDPTGVLRVEKLGIGGRRNSYYAIGATVVKSNGTFCLVTGNSTTDSSIAEGMVDVTPVYGLEGVSCERAQTLRKSSFVMAPLQKSDLIAIYSRTGQVVGSLYPYQYNPQQPNNSQQPRAYRIPSRVQIGEWQYEFSPISSYTSRAANTRMALFKTTLNSARDALIEVERTKVQLLSRAIKMPLVERGELWTTRIILLIQRALKTELIEEKSDKFVYFYPPSSATTDTMYLIFSLPFELTHVRRYGGFTAIPERMINILKDMHTQFLLEIAVENKELHIIPRAFVMKTSEEPYKYVPFRHYHSMGDYSTCLGSYGPLIVKQEPKGLSKATENKILSYISSFLRAQKIVNLSSVALARPQSGWPTADELAIACPFDESRSGFCTKNKKEANE